MDWQDFSLTLNRNLDRPLRISTVHSVAGGDIHKAYRLHTDRGNLFLKMNRRECLPLFETELRNLNAIRQTHSIQAPKPFACGIYEDKSWLVMAYLPLTGRGDDRQRGKDLALMHHQLNQDSRYSTQPFGWFEDNYIGNNRQSNRWHSDWVGFYGSERLAPQLELASLRGASPQLFEEGHRLIRNLPLWFESYHPQASLLHGDLWGGNSAFTENGDPVIFDPASYYGDRETDLAMTELFGGFSDDFYQGYHEVFPLDSGYQSRKPLYNLYHLLNHYNLFGGHYQTQSLQAIRQLLKSKGL
ncbi:fructosamine kinase family protein [Thiomicrorhabdus sp.]|uniref:fructosamine kinase family protein n=1 Tax=Thiomicrorhabdus sp. TaxID=2039724 RepID=UPI0029C83566|nr:fructosamine kinase family protein [Thiomicrorhabdus sp.]